MKIFCVRIGDKYGPEYEAYIEMKLFDYDIHWIREPFDPRVALQWNKMAVMNLDLDEAVVVMDIDVILMNDYKKIFDFPIKRGEFAAMPDWWQGEGKGINGGFFKYYPKDCKPIYDEFMSDPKMWHHYRPSEWRTTFCRRSCQEIWVTSNPFARQMVHPMGN